MILKDILGGGVDSDRDKRPVVEMREVTWQDDTRRDNKHSLTMETKERRGGFLSKNIIIYFLIFP